MVTFATEKKVEKIVDEKIVEEAVGRDIWRPKLKNSPSLQVVEEQNEAIKDVLKVCTSDSAFAQKAYDAIVYILTQEEPGVPEVATVTSVSPAAGVVGDPAVELHVIGTGFTAASIITLDSNAQVTAFVSATELTTQFTVPVIAGDTIVSVQGATGSAIFTTSGLSARSSVIGKESGPVKESGRK